ncbi:hypothetical protein PWY87_17460 [Kribbella solani]|uniref:hypothetical protein n=1 Tax=Kribbella solani TaxID=236067 RepID=UPI0029BF73F3|nr:hypothetical protein [Kribbella solani]MDX3003479.1 hypothetical protein [Kribbella solani]
MSIVSDWQAIDVELSQQAPRILADLRPPITESEAENWAHTAGVLPVELRELYDVHAGTATRGSSGFSFIGEWYPFTVDEALMRYHRCRRMAESWERPPLIPFAIDLSGSYLAVRPGGSGDLSIILDDAGDAPYERYPDIATLVARTVDGLRGNSPDSRAELAEQYLSWTNLEEEADDHGY